MTGIAAAESRYGRSIIGLGSLWLALTLLVTAWPVEHGGRAQYFPDARWAGRPVFTRLDRTISSTALFRAWGAQPPEAFSAQWTGVLRVPAGGRILGIESTGLARLFVDGTLVAEVVGRGDRVPATAPEPIPAGNHRIVVHYSRQGSRAVVELLWGGEGANLAPVPSWALTPGAPSAAARVTPWVRRAWQWLSAGLLVLLFAVAVQDVWRRRAPRARLSLAVRASALSALAVVFVIGAIEHGRVVNTSKARGDQSGYLWDAQLVYANWNGRMPPVLVGERMRMPVYAGYLAAFYTPRLSDAEFFEVAKVRNIALAVGTMAGLAVIFALALPPLASFNLTVAVAFGFWVFKAGYAQPELLFYFLFFATFVSCLWLWRGAGRRRDLAVGGLAGALAGLTFLTKALIPPFVALYLVTFAGRELWHFLKARDGRLVRRLAAGGMMLATFLAVAAPYILNSKREFGSYFYNANTAHFIWFDDGAEARAVMMPHIDLEGRFSMPIADRPTLQSYLRTRTPGQIADRLLEGLGDIGVRSLATYLYWPIVLAYAGLALVVALANRGAVLSDLRRHAWLVLFLVGYAGIYLAGTAMFAATSGTGTTRFFITHLTPFLFVVTLFLSRQPYRATTWRVGPSQVGLGHIHWAMTAALAGGLATCWWPRLMGTYGGF